MKVGEILLIVNQCVVCLHSFVVECGGRMENMCVSLL